MLVDRLLAGPLWYTAYATLLATDLRDVLVSAVSSGTPLRNVFADRDRLSRLEPGVTALTGVAPTRMPGGPWVTVEHPDRVADVVRSALADWR